MKVFIFAKSILTNKINLQSIMNNQSFVNEQSGDSKLVYMTLENGSVRFKNGDSVFSTIKGFVPIEFSENEKTHNGITYQEGYITFSIVTEIDEQTGEETRQNFKLKFDLKKRESTDLLPSLINQILTKTAIDVRCYADTPHEYGGKKYIGKRIFVYASGTKGSKNDVVTDSKFDENTKDYSVKIGNHFFVVPKKHKLAKAKSLSGVDEAVKKSIGEKTDDSATLYFHQFLGLIINELPKQKDPDKFLKEKQASWALYKSKYDSLYEL